MKYFYYLDKTSGHVYRYSRTQCELFFYSELAHDWKPLIDCECIKDINYRKVAIESRLSYFKMKTMTYKDLKKYLMVQELSK